MMIVNEKMSNIIDFSDLSPGDVFFFPLEKWYGMRLDGATSEGENAIDLQTGELAYLLDGDQVVSLNDAHLVI